MSLELSESDSAAIDRVQIDWTNSAWSSDGTIGMSVLLGAIYTAGMRAGIERAAKVAETHFIYGHTVAGPHFAAACAEKIRALLDAPPR